jgi:hypothetical protein
MTYLCHAPMLHRVSMDVIDMPVEVRLIVDKMLPGEAPALVEHSECGLG